jgi:tetratricopeptide (TPR) repeat protein
MEKAFLLHPSYKSQYLLLGQLGSFLDEMDYKNPRQLGFLVKAYGLIGFGVEKEMIRSYFIDIVNSILAKEDDRKTFDNIRDYLHEYIPDQELNKEFEFHSLYQYGRLEFEDARYGEALVYLEDAFRLYPDNEDNQNLLVRALAGYASTVSPAVILEKIEEYDTAFTELESEDVLMLVKAQTYLEVFGQSFQLQDRENGEKYMARFEDLANRHPGTLTDHFRIGRSYSSAAIYYYRKGLKERSREVLNKGLKYAPGNIDLKLKLAAFE